MFYKKRSKRYTALEMQICNYVNGVIGYVILGTRDRSVKQYIKDSEDYQKLMEPKNTT